MWRALAGAQDSASIPEVALSQVEQGQNRERSRESKSKPRMYIRGSSRGEYYTATGRIRSIPTSSPASTDFRGDNRTTASAVCRRAEFRRSRPPARRRAATAPAIVISPGCQRGPSPWVTRARTRVSLAHSQPAPSNRRTRQPGQGYSARIFSAISLAGKVQSITANPRESLGASVARASSWTIAVTRSACKSFIV